MRNNLCESLADEGGFLLKYPGSCWPGNAFSQVRRRDADILIVSCKRDVFHEITYFLTNHRYHTLARTVRLASFFGWSRLQHDIWWHIPQNLYGLVLCQNKINVESTNVITALVN